MSAYNILDAYKYEYAKIVDTIVTFLFKLIYLH